MPILARASITPSLFDRLTDHEPRHTKEATPPEQLQRELYKAGVARALTSVLNTLQREEDIPEEYELVRQSVLAYGMPDFTTAPMDRDAIRQAVERVIRVFEPRLSRVEVAFEPEPGRRDVEQLLFRFVFRISAVLRLDVGSEPVVYDAVLPKELRRFQVTVGR